MCILCVIQKCSRRIATMLPWLVIPLIGLWAMSQLLPPAFRFEITSPRLACVMVLLVTLFWYEILMPQLSAWRAKRNALHRERMRFEAIELQKLRKTATRKCRNCQTAYRDQNPGGGKFMCSYCGHISKRPVLDLPVPLDAGNSGIFKDLMGKGGRILTSKPWSESGWMCGQDWLDNGNWGSASFSGKSNYWRKNCGDIFGAVEGHCPTEKSYSRVSGFPCKLLTAFFSCIMWLWRKIFRVSSSRDDASGDADRREMLESRGETGGVQESRGEKSRRKAEEKRLARLEKELLEEEERKQREEVARLVEERRKLRDEKLEAEKECEKGSANTKERDSRMESDMKRKEKRREKDRASSKSNSDVEELEKRAGKENERNKKGEADKRDPKRFTPEYSKTRHVEPGKVAAVSNQSRGNAGTRYLDRMKGTFLSSSRAFTRGDFFGKSISGSNFSREQKPVSVVENSHAFIPRKEVLQQDHCGRSSYSIDNKSANARGPSELQPFTAAKQSWIRLFPQSSASLSPSISPSSNRPAGKYETELPNPTFGGHDNSTESFNNSFNCGQSAGFSLPSFPLESVGHNSVVSVPSESVLPKVGDPPSFLPEDSEIYGDPCYVPDAKYLLGPVSESLDNFQLDVSSLPDRGLEKPYPVKTKSTAPEVMKPSPIESPLSRTHVSVERHSNSFLFSGTPTAHDNLTSSNELRAWQMWNNPPIIQDVTGFDLIGGPVSWLFHRENSIPQKEELLHLLPNKAISSVFKKDEHLLSGVQHPQNPRLGSFQNGGTFNTHAPAVVEGPWMPQIFPGPEKETFKKHGDETVDQRLMHEDSGGSVNHHPELSWHKKDSGGQPPRDVIGNSPITRSHIGGLYSPPDVQSLWSFD